MEGADWNPWDGFTERRSSCTHAHIVCGHGRCRYHRFYRRSTALLPAALLVALRFGAQALLQRGGGVGVLSAWCVPLNAALLLAMGWLSVAPFTKRPNCFFFAPVGWA